MIILSSPSLSVCTVVDGFQGVVVNVIKLVVFLLSDNRKRIAGIVISIAVRNFFPFKKKLKLVQDLCAGVIILLL